MTKEMVVAIPGFIHHGNLAVFPAKSKQDSHVYLFGTSCVVPVDSGRKVQVEYLENHIYCLLPSYQPTLGTVCYYTECPAFIEEFRFGIDLGAVPHPETYPDIKTESGKLPKKEDKNVKEVEEKKGEGKKKIEEMKGEEIQAEQKILEEKKQEEEKSKKNKQEEVQKREEKRQEVLQGKKRLIAYWVNEGMKVFAKHNDYRSQQGT